MEVRRVNQLQGKYKDNKTAPIHHSSGSKHRAWRIALLLNVLQKDISGTLEHVMTLQPMVRNSTSGMRERSQRRRMEAYYHKSL